MAEKRLIDIRHSLEDKPYIVYLYAVLRPSFMPNAVKNGKRTQAEIRHMAVGDNTNSR